MAAGTRAALRNTGDVGSLGAAGAESFDGIAHKPTTTGVIKSWGLEEPPGAVANLILDMALPPPPLSVVAPAAAALFVSVVIVATAPRMRRPR